MEIDDDLANFIRERKARVAEDKASLDQDPPYMEMKAKPHRASGSPLKENIPPKQFAQAKEESYSVGLPLGVEYEKKKQRLRHELRMDYRRYMAQQLLEKEEGLPPKQHTPSLRDAATPPEADKRLQRDLCLTEALTLNPEREKGHLSLSQRRRDRLERSIDEVSEDKEFKLVEGRRGRYTKVEAEYEKRQPKQYEEGEEENRVGTARADRRSAARTKNDAEFATGLIMGTADTDEALQRRKERYRQELQEQIAEQHRNKKWEKELELNVAATGANDPEKQPDRIRQFGLGRRKNHQVLEPLATGDSELSSRALPNIGKIAVGQDERRPPNQPHVAFQSPLLEYSSALSMRGGGGLSPTSHPAVSTFHRAMNTPRPFPPHPPTTLSEVLRSSYADPYHYYGTRNHLDPNMAYYGQMPFPAGGLPMPYWNVPLGGAVASQLENHSPHSENSGGSFPEPEIQPIHEAVDSHVTVFPLEKPRSTRNRILSYREALKQQIQEQNDRKRLEREERERYEAQLEADMKSHQPWGRGGGGAPLRDSTGNLIVDLNHMHKLNEEAYSNPEQWQRRVKAAMMTGREDHSDRNGRVSATVAECSIPDSGDRVSGFAHVHTPQFARGNVFANQPTQQQLQEQENYKTYLKKQIEEKMRKKVEEREQLRLEEEKEEKRLAEQRARIQREYEEEQEKKKRKEMEQKAKNEELIQLAEQRKQEAERRKKEEEESAALRRQYEMERQARVVEVHREPSPPIPTLQKKHGLGPRTPRPPTVDSQLSTAPLTECSLSGLQSPPVPARRNQLRAAGNHGDVFSELSVLRRQLRSEQKRLEGCLQQEDWEVMDSPLSDRHPEHPPVDVFDMARLRLQAPVRRPHSRNMDPRNHLQLQDSFHLKYTDAESRLGFSDLSKPEEVDVFSRRRVDYREPYNRFSSQRLTVQDDYFDLPPQQNNDLRNVIRGFARGSLLESESAFIDPLGDAVPVPYTLDLQKNPLLSARERRRVAKQSQHPKKT